MEIFIDQPFKIFISLLDQKAIVLFKEQNNIFMN
jgi:hypothetical protein